MINHTRTLLMNRSRHGFDYETPGEEYIAPTFIRRVLPADVSRLYSHMFGNNPDRLFINYRMQQLMKLIHATPLAADVILDDDRLTYMPFQDSFPYGLFTSTITNRSNPDVEIYIHGTHTADGSYGYTQYEWKVQKISDTEIQVTRLKPVVQTVIYEAAFVNNLSSPVVLVGSNLTTRMRMTDNGFNYRITSTARPVQDITSVLKPIEYLFYTAGGIHIFPADITDIRVKYRNIWLSNSDYVMRWAAMFLAMAKFNEMQPTEV